MWSLEMLKCTHFFHNKYCNQNATQRGCFVPYVSLTSGLLVGKQLCLIWNIVQNKFLLCDWALCSDGAAAGASITEIINSWSHCEQEQYHMPNTNRILANNISQHWLHMCVNLRRKQPSGVYRNKRQSPTRWQRDLTPVGVDKVHMSGTFQWVGGQTIFLFLNTNYTSGTAPLYHSYGENTVIKRKQSTCPLQSTTTVSSVFMTVSSDVWD